jgi:predicted TIM-barrel fold metal-dependent hydrolase
MLKKDFVVDADSHWCERPDLFTSMAPPELRDRVPRVEEIDGQLMWVFDGHPSGKFSAGGVVARDGSKEDSETALHSWTFDQIHEGAHNPTARLKVMDESGIDAQVIFPSTIGLGGQGLAGTDEALSRLVIEMYNDRQAEIQSESNNRLLPMPLMPAWDIDACVREVRRVAAMGARGVNMTSDPQDLGAPDLADPAWDPFWEACTEQQMPVHFHIGASVTTMTFYGKYSWPSLAPSTRLAVGGTLLFIGNARVVANLIVSGIFDRHPDLRTVSVESGCGWIPFILEALDYEMAENAPSDLAKLRKMPSEYFKSNLYATYWFESSKNKLPALIESVGEDNILFETDFPHPTCLYPNPVERAQVTMEALTPEVRGKILGENARKLYRL